MKYCLIIIMLFFSASSFADKPINLDFQNIPVRDVLQLLAKMNHSNIIVSDSVKSDITLHLENVTWEQALDVILQEQHLGQQRINNVIVISPLEDMSPESQTISLHYAKAADVANLIKNQNKSLLSEHGNVSADPRTNSLWIEDVPDKLSQIILFIKKIDVPLRQVLIEARIVTVDEKYEQELGVRFGLTRPNNNLTGTLAGANGLAQNISPASIDPLSRLSVDLPTHNANSGSIGLALATLGNTNLLDLELSAIETEGAGQIISSPRLMTADQQPATILSGQEIPYQQAANYGATSVAFQKAVLSLTVTPQITPSNKLLLTLQLTQDRPGASLIQGVPEIDTRQIQTQVLVNNNQTLVLGGIYEQNQNNQVERIPFLGSLPVIGGLFRHTLKSNNRRELLIFVTPQILESGLY